MGLHLALATETDPVQVLDTLLKTATKPGGKRIGAVAQLCVLGGTAGIIDGLITRDRGSKETDDGKRTAGKFPFRVRLYRIVEDLSKTVGGLKTLHSMAVAHVTGKPAKR